MEEKILVKYYTEGHMIALANSIKEVLKEQSPISIKLDNRHGNIEVTLYNDQPTIINNKSMLIGIVTTVLASLSNRRQVLVYKALNEKYIVRSDFNGSFVKDMEEKHNIKITKMSDVLKMDRLDQK